MSIERQSNVIAAVFHNSEYGRSKRYHYFCPYPVAVDDHVIVDSPIGGYTCVKVVDILPNGSIKATKRVIQVVDDSDYKAQAEREKRVAEIEAALERRTKEYSKLQFFKKMAEIDPISKKLVEELEALAA
ncbi:MULTISPECIES: hypothetical protein [unclassified Mesorhizobium]|uniref:hypothetical protein n=1 Tax=unclassified Mesorhizobium TaxID=325217 RepID=UPI00112B27AC|nr:MULTISPECIES: hypothetical protein [unclassified Mesorhizobium]TPJ51622.1 hypothetical protein FJ426_20535 [Mesorhizobium sp. B2-6-4]TPN42300.1 hypothetical protein FJ979_01815 [Mesorhizobium sp. B1-1-6]